ncbi:hypothetical protein WME76_04360 [Sorangium sp. So ce119]|uniref:hypothetical protein n=1 Tax=Sorangium sp. So ce119 TaxID=3133279 RepID=UPI003F5EA551
MRVIEGEELGLPLYIVQGGWGLVEPRGNERWFGFGLYDATDCDVAKEKLHETNAPEEQLQSIRSPNRRKKLLYHIHNVIGALSAQSVLVGKLQNTFSGKCALITVYTNTSSLNPFRPIDVKGRSVYSKVLRKTIFSIEALPGYDSDE